MIRIYPLEWFFGIEPYVALDRNPGSGYPTLAVDLRRTLKCMSQYIIQFPTLPI